MSETTLHAPLPVGSPGHKAGGWFGMMTLIVTEASLFLYLLFSYYYFALWGNGAFVPSPLPKFELALPDTAILLLSSLTVWWGERGTRKSSRRQIALGLIATIVLGAVFVAIQLIEWAQKPFHFNSSAYSALYFTVTGFHMVHVVVGLIILASLLVWDWLGYFDRRRHAPFAIGAVYWHFVDVVWLAVFFTIYVTPHLGLR
jgi:heme/copper-type cytochrome/quinol oxidase subunit 3